MPITLPALPIAAALPRRAGDLPPTPSTAVREANPRSDVFCTVERRPGLARPQGSVGSLAG